MSVLPSGSVLRMVAAGYGPAAPPDVPGLPRPGLAAGGPPEAARDARALAEGHGSEEGAVDSAFSTLRNHLQDLANNFDPRQVFITRGISRMGFQSKKLLEAYFARYGKVVRVMVPYSKSKRLARNLHPQARVHPGSLAFVVMADAECVGRILAASAEHGVEGYAVRVEKFQQMSGMLSDPQSESVEHACVGPREAASAARGYAVRVERFQQMSGMLSDQQSDGVEHVFVGSPESASAGCAPAARPPGLARRAAAPLGPAAVGPTAGWRCAGPPAAAPPFGLGVREAGTAPGYLGVGLDESLLHSPAVAAQLSDPNSVLCRLASIAREWESAAVASGENCVQAITATQVAQLQLQGLLDRCTQNLRALWLNREHSQGGAPVALDQLEGLLAEQACAAEVPPLLGVSGAAWPGGDPQDGRPPRSGAGAGAAAGPQQSRGLQWQPGARPERWLAASEQVESEQRLGAEAEAAPPPCRAAGGAAAGRQARARAGRASGEESGSSGHEEGWRRLSLHNGSMGDLLTMLNGEDPLKVFIVRGIDSLGVDSHEILASHYWDFGSIERVLVPHSKVTAKLYRSEKTVTRSRVRPGSMGFVVMSDSKSVERILQAGGQQVVAGKCIRVEPFRMPAPSTTVSTSVGSTSISGPSSSNQSRSDTSSSHGSHAVSQGSCPKSDSRSGDSGSSDSKGGPEKYSNCSEKDDGSRSNDSETGSGSNGGTGAAPRSAGSGSGPADRSSAGQGSGGEEAACA